MINHIKYALNKYFCLLGKIATVIGILKILPNNGVALENSIVIFCFVLAFVIPFLDSYKRRTFKLKTVGKSNVLFAFGDLFNEECFVITTNRHFDVDPTGEYISDGSVLGKFVNEYFRNNANKLEDLIKTELYKDKGGNSAPFEYGKSVKIQLEGKVIYFLAFTDRNKADQPEDFYIQAIQTFFETIINENHGKTIAVPLLGDNNNLSNSGFSNSEMSFTSLIAMINNFEIVNQRSELKLKIVALPEKRSELINVVLSYSR